VKNERYTKTPIVAIMPSGESDPLLSKHSQTTGNNSPAIDMTQEVYLKNGQEGIIAIDIQDGYDKFNDNVKIISSTALKTQTL
jgi:hypothetical protein